MKNTFLLLIAVLFAITASSAQEKGPSPLELPADPTHIFYENELNDEGYPVLSYPGIDERDVFWQKTVWRVIDTREKINLVFRYPEMPFIKILLDEIKAENIKAYGTEDDKFSQLLCWADIQNMTATRDTVVTFDPVTYEEQIQVVTNNINLDDIKKYRFKEVWYFDSKYSTMKVRILGIAPVIDVIDDQGNFRYEKPLFWVYYPQTRKTLARHLVFNEGNTASSLTWEDHLEMRFFGSYITKESNVQNRRLQDYLSGLDLLQESEKIKQEIFNFEQDLWSY